MTAAAQGCQGGADGCMAAESANVGGRQKKSADHLEQTKLGTQGGNSRRRIPETNLFNPLCGRSLNSPKMLFLPRLHRKWDLSCSV